MRAVLVLAVVLLVAAPARADWSAPVALSPAGSIAQGNQRVVANARGDAVVVWKRNDRAEAAARAAGGPFSRPVLLDKGVSDVPYAALNENGDAIAVWVDQRTLTAVWLGSGKKITLPDAACSIDVEGVAIDAAGTATLFWTTCEQLFYADVPRDGTPGPARLAAERASTAEVRGAADGTQVVLWFDRQAGAVGVRPPGGAFTAVALPSTATPHAAMNRGGTAVVSWLEPGGLRAIVKPPGGAFGAPLAYGPPTRELSALAVDPAGNATAITRDLRSVFAVPVGAGAAEKIGDVAPCGVWTDHGADGSLFVAGNVSCGGGRIWGAARPAGGRFSGKLRLLGPAEASNHPPALAGSGAGAIVAWPIGIGPPHNRHLVAAVAWRATPLVAFAGIPRVRDGRLRVRVRTSSPVTVRMTAGGRSMTRRVNGARTLSVRAPRRSSFRVVLAVRGGDEITRRVRLR